MEEQNEKAMVEYKARDGVQIKLTPGIIKKYLVSGRSEFVTDQELYMYMGLCKSRGLNPFIRDCYITKFSPHDPAAIITSIDYYRKRAKAQRDCKGWTTGIILLDIDKQLVYRKGCILLDDEKLIGGWCEAKPEGWDVPVRKEVNLKRYIKKTKEGVVTRFWSEDNQPEQIAKVAESQCLRTAWPDEFQGLYTDAEMESMRAQDEFNDAVKTGESTVNTGQPPEPIKFNPPPVVTDPGLEPGQTEPTAETEQPGPEDSGPPPEPPPATPPPAPEKPRRGRPAKAKTEAPKESPKEVASPTQAPATNNHAKQQANMLFEATIREWSARASKNVDQMLHFAAIWIEGVIQDSLMHYPSYDDAYIKVRERAVDSWTAKAAPLFIDYLNKNTASSGGEIPQDEPPPADVTQTELQPGENEPEPGSYEPDEEQPNAIIGYQNCASYSEAVNYFKVHAGVFSLPENTAALKVAKEWFEAKYKRPFPALLIASAGQAQQQRAAAPSTPAPEALDESMVAQIAAIRKSDAQGLLKVAMKLQMSTSNLSPEGMNRILDGYTEYRQDPVAFMKK